MGITEAIATTRQTDTIAALAGNPAAHIIIIYKYGATRCRFVVCSFLFPYYYLGRLSTITVPYTPEPTT
jgi:hypothetical protein